MLTVSELFIYPIKSLGGIAVTEAVVTDRGFEHDRRWMLVDMHNNFITQREVAQLALLQVELTTGGLHVYHKTNPQKNIHVPFIPQTGATVMVEVWSDRCRAQLVSATVDEWFSNILSIPCRLVYMPETTRRRVDSRYATQKEITSLSDGYPFLIIGQASLDDLNSRLPETLPINRFRPNIVFTGGEAFDEDRMKKFTIGNVLFTGVKLCARCVVTTINQEDASKVKEPLKTLAAYRRKNNNIYFGQNLLHEGQGTVAVGDALNIQEWKE